MGTLDDVQSMRRDGKNETDIVADLQQRGLSQQEINGVMSQSKIKDAVQGSEESEDTMSAAPVGTNPGTQEYDESMSASVMTQPSTAQAAEVQETQQPAAEEGYQGYSQQAPEGYSQQQYDYSGYQPAGIGSDVITEIADQVVAERLAPLTTNIDKIIDMRSTMDSQIRFLDERIKRIEKIIDRLQLSLLQRVGEYVSNVEDIKSELTETNKTFKALADMRDAPSRGEKKYNPQVEEQQ